MHLRPHDCDQLLADLVPPDRAEVLRAHAAECPACGERLAAATQAREAFLAHNPPALRVQELLEARRPGWRNWLFAGAGTVLLAAAAILLLVVDPRGDGIRVKGGAVSCRLDRGGEVLGVIGPGQELPARPGDRLVCTVTPAGGRHLAVWGVESGAAVPLMNLELTGPTQLPTAFAVTGSGPMSLYFVSSPAPIAPATVERALVGGAAKIDGASIERVSVRVGETL